MKHRFTKEQQRQFRLQNEFLLDENNIPYPCEDVLSWGQGMAELSKSGRTFVKQEYVGKAWVSTVFLGINHNFGLDGDPVLFETMVFMEGKGGHDEHMDRYCTWAEAEEGHQAIVDMVRMAEEMKD